jgi:site-specific DNA-methyltransferase (adenine-specific)
VSTATRYADGPVPPERWRNSIVRYGEEAPEQLLAHPLNPKIHPRHQQEALAGALGELGWIAPVIVNETTQTVIDGHARIGLAISRQEATVPVAYVRLTPEQERLALLTFDPIGAMAATDRANLEELLKDVRTDDAALRSALRDLADDNGLAWGGDPAPGEVPEAEVDRAEELREQWGTSSGQLWVVGRHRLLCGDCRNPEDIARLCTDKVQGVFTSPPYAEQRKDQYGGVPVDEYVDWWAAVQANVRDVLRPDGSFFVNIKPHCEDGERVLYVMDLVLAMRRAWGWRHVDEFCWLNPGVPGAWPNRFKDGWEPVFQFAVGPDGKFRPDAVRRPSDYEFSGSGGMSGRGGGGRYIPNEGPYHRGTALPSNVIETASGDGGHPAAFPVPLVAFFLQAFSDPGDVWLDTFMGSGTTVVAAQQHGRIGYGMEIEPKYVAVALERLAKLGLTPRLEDGG